MNQILILYTKYMQNQFISGEFREKLKRNIVKLKSILLEPKLEVICQIYKRICA